MPNGLLDSINLRYGTGKHGNCLIGPSLPFGIVRLGPDISYPQPQSGYRPGKPIIGFSHTRLSGTGGAARYGNIRVMPVAGDVRKLEGAPWFTFPATHRNWSKPVEETAEVGYYRCRFGFGVTAELSCTSQVGVHRYTFDEGKRANLLIDFAALLQAGVAPAGESPYCETWEAEGINTGGEVVVSGNGELSGRADFKGGWGHVHPYSVYYFIRTPERPAEICLAGESGVLANAERGKGRGLRAVLAFPDEVRQVRLEVGISFKSIEHAKAAVETESAGAELETIVERCRSAWAPWVDLIQVEGGTDDQRALLATSLQHLFVLPTNMAPDGGVTPQGGPVFDDLTCLWDSIRNANSLWHLIAPELSADLMNSLLHQADKSGWLPDAHFVGELAYQQSGCCAEILFSEAARKGVPGVDYRRALAACVRNAETPSDRPDYYGRHLGDYETLGYLSTDVPKGSVSRHIEYTYQDWCIARLAEFLGETEIAVRFDEKARRLWNLWDEKNRAFMPRHPDGSWVDGVNPDEHSWDGWNDPYSYEGALRYWSFSGLHDIDGLIARYGGAETFSDFIEEFLNRPGKLEKETRMHIPHLHAFAGYPERTAARVKRSLTEAYINSADGMPDDEDMGCQSAYYICNAIGLYPIYGRTFYSVVPPLFERVTLAYGKTGRSLTIVRIGGGDRVKAVRINGVEQAGTLIEHALIAAGGTLEIETD